MRGFCGLVSFVVVFLLLGCDQIQGQVPLVDVLMGSFSLVSSQNTFCQTSSMRTDVDQATPAVRMRLAQAAPDEVFSPTVPTTDRKLNVLRRAPSTFNYPDTFLVALNWTLTQSYQPAQVQCCVTRLDSPVGWGQTLTISFYAQVRPPCGCYWSPLLGVGGLGGGDFSDWSVSSFGASPITSILMKSQGTYLDYWEVAHSPDGFVLSSHGEGNRGVGTGLSLGPIEYFDTVSIYSADYVHGMRLTTNLGRSVLGGMPYGSVTTYSKPAHRIAFFAGRQGGWTDQVLPVFVRLNCSGENFGSSSSFMIPPNYNTFRCGLPPLPNTTLSNVYITLMARGRKDANFMLSPTYQDTEAPYSTSILLQSGLGTVLRYAGIIQSTATNDARLATDSWGMYWFMLLNGTAAFGRGPLGDNVLNVATLPYPALPPNPLTPYHTLAFAAWDYPAEFANITINPLLGWNSSVYMAIASLSLYGVDATWGLPAPTVAFSFTLATLTPPAAATAALLLSTRPQVRSTQQCAQATPTTCALLLIDLGVGVVQLLSIPQQLALLPPAPFTPPLNGSLNVWLSLAYDSVSVYVEDVLGGTGRQLILQFSRSLIGPSSQPTPTPIYIGLAAQNKPATFSQIQQRGCSDSDLVFEEASSLQSIIPCPACSASSPLDANKAAPQNTYNNNTLCDVCPANYYAVRVPPARVRVPCGECGSGAGVWPASTPRNVSCYGRGGANQWVWAYALPPTDLQQPAISFTLYIATHHTCNLNANPNTPATCVVCPAGTSSPPGTTSSLGCLPNPILCAYCPPPNIGLIVGVVVACVAIVAVLGGYRWYKATRPQPLPLPYHPPQPPENDGALAERQVSDPTLFDASVPMSVRQLVIQPLSAIHNQPPPAYA